MNDDLKPVRLTGDKPKKVVEFAQAQNENRRLRDENKRLRKALEEIRDAKPTIPNTISYLPSKPTKLQKIASQALEGGNTNG